MAYLTRDELDGLNPDKIYNIPTFVLHYELWANIDPSLSSILNSPVRIQFDEKIRDNLGTLKKLKGIYVFLVEPDFPLTPKTSYFVYVGRVMNTNTFYNRFRDYVKGIGSKKVRRNIQLLTNMWPGKTWVYFYSMSVSDAEIERIEANLFDNIIPPLNNQFRSKRAKRSRSIYN